jgi:PhzF family phenazine biosynthesis protein
MPKAGAELWELLVYCSENALGNPTGVVFLRHSLPEPEYQRIASALGYPDTAFILPGPKLGEPRVRAFSPAQEIQFCTQATLAAYRVLQLKTPEVARESMRLHVGSGPVTVGESSQRPGVAWLKWRTKVLVGEVKRTLPVFGTEAEFTGGTVIETVRRRVYYHFDNPVALAEARMDPNAVLDFCRAARVHGICLLTQTGERQVALRVFNTSLDGHEDAATGGAAMGILPFLAETGASVKPDLWWTVHQGCGEPHRRGELYTMLLPDLAMAVGGKHRFIMRGQLL